MARILHSSRSSIVMPPRVPTRAALAVLSLGALVAAGLATVPAAQSAPDPSCPAAFPVASIVEGQRVTGLTVSKGATPSSFTGEVVGVLDDGIAPDLDLVMVRLSSAALTAAGGVWSGMSGSPVYARDGRLVGAVSYGLGMSPTMIAGVTPAADMQALLTTDTAEAQRSVAAAAQNETIDLPRALSSRLVSSGAAEAAEVDEGLSRLRLPVAVSGLSSRRMRQAAKLMPTPNVRLYKSSSASPQGPEISVVAGGNLAASASYGDVTWAGVGTATAVCGDEVLAFGHPFMYSGRTSLTMHGADVLYVQQDPYWGGAFKVTNLGAPVGAVDADRMAGLHGVLGPAPRVTTVTSYVEAEGRSRTGSTRISFQPDTPGLAATHMWADQDRVLDAWSKGSGTAAWTVSGTRAGGKDFSYTRSDRYASTWDISYEIPWGLYTQLLQLQANEFEPVTVKTIRTTSRLTTRYERYVVKSAQVRKAGAWVKLKGTQPLRLRAGSTQRFRVALSSLVLGTRQVVLRLAVPRGAAGRSGALTIMGGNSFGADEYYEGEGTPSGVSSLDQLLRKFRTDPRNDHVLADLRIFGKGGKALSRQARSTVEAVTDGTVDVGVRVVRR